MTLKMSRCCQTNISAIKKSIACFGRTRSQQKAKNTERQAKMQSYAEIKMPQKKNNRATAIREYLS